MLGIGIGAATNFVGISGDGILEHAPHIGVLLDELRRPPGCQADQVVKDENLSVAMRPRADADRRNRKRRGRFPRQIARHAFEHDREGAGMLRLLRLLAAGKSNRAIAEALYISPTTVASHLASIFGKLGVDSRTQVVAFAHRHDLV